MGRLEGKDSSEEAKGALNAVAKLAQEGMEIARPLDLLVLAFKGQEPMLVGVPEVLP